VEVRSKPDCLKEFQDQLTAAGITLRWKDVLAQQP
jgi:hypothetical protein